MKQMNELLKSGRNSSIEYKGTLHDYACTDVSWIARADTRKRITVVEAFSPVKGKYESEMIWNILQEINNSCGVSSPVVVDYEKAENRIRCRSAICGIGSDPDSATFSYILTMSVLAIRKTLSMLAISQAEGWYE